MYDGEAPCLAATLPQDGIGISDDPTLLIESVDAPTPAVLVEKNKLNILGFRTDCSDYLAVHKIYDVGTPLFGDEEWGQCVKFEEAVVASGKHINPYRKRLTGKEMAMSSGLFSIELSDDNKKQFSEGLAAYEEGFEAAKQTLNSDKNSSDLEDALDEISRDARSEIRNFRRTLPPTAPEKWTAKIAVELMRQEGEWLPGFIPAELVNEFSDKVMKPKQPKSPHIFEDHNGEKKWFSGFVNTIDRRVLQKAVDAGLRATINEEDFEKVATRFSDNVRNPDSAWGSYRDAQADLFNAVRDLYLKSTSRDADG
mgnify:CR=1 FL=1